MGKRINAVGNMKASHSRKTAKRLEIKKARLAELAAKRDPKQRAKLTK